jgi:hypothetical protein
VLVAQEQTAAKVVVIEVTTTEMSPKKKENIDN